MSCKTSIYFVFGSPLDRAARPFRGGFPEQLLRLRRVGIQSHRRPQHLLGPLKVAPSQCHLSSIESVAERLRSHQLPEDLSDGVDGRIAQRLHGLLVVLLTGLHIRHVTVQVEPEFFVQPDGVLAALQPDVYFYGVWYVELPTFDAAEGVGRCRFNESRICVASNESDSLVRTACEARNSQEGVVNPT